MTPVIPSDFRAAYEEERADLTYASLRLYCVACFIINQAFKLFDHLLYPAQFPFFLTVRLVLDATLAVAYFVVTRRNSLRMRLVCLIATGAMLTIVVDGVGTYDNDYYVGFLLLMFGMSLLFQMTQREAFVLSSLLYLTYLVPAMLGRPIDVPEKFLAQNVFLLSGILVSTVSGRVGERIRVLEFLGRNDLKQAYGKLKELDEAKSQFFSNVSHELRTPLSLLLAPLDAMIHGDIGEFTQKQRRHLASMHDNGLRLLRQINHLLDVVKIDAHRAVLQREETDIGLFLENLVRTAQPLAKHKGLSLVSLVSPDLPHVAVDPEKLEKIVLNLLSNAIKFSPVGGSVLLTAGTEEEHVRIRVSDNGIGIDAEFLPHLFDRFTQAEGAGRYGGTGIGLTLVKEFTEMHGGQVQAESRPGGGSTFTVTLPIGSPDVDARAASKVPADASRPVALEMSDAKAMEEIDPAHEYPSSSVDAPMLLIVDDNPDMLRFMADALGGVYHVLTARDGLRALVMAAERRPDLIISDVIMPGIDGLELVRRLREGEETARIPIILVTARVGLDQKIEGMQQGADDYLYKPFSMAELRARVEGLLRQRRMERELASQNQELAAQKLLLEDLLLHQEKLSTLGELLASTAHELATPITYLAANARILDNYLVNFRRFFEEATRAGEGGRSDLVALAEELDLGESFFEDLEDLVRGFIEGSRRSKEILRNLRNYSRKDEQSLCETDLRSCIESSLLLLKSHMKGRIRVHRDDDPALPAVQCIEGQVKQVIVNLVANAIQAIEGEGDIWIATRLQNDGAQEVPGPCVTIDIRDSGCGIAPSMIEEIFRPFVTTRKDQRGTGLGLPICREIMVRHGGRILVESTLGAGATFTVMIPVVPPIGRFSRDGGSFSEGPSTPQTTH